ncbi:MAG: zinc ribbon domain-containing protein [Lachnospiraceae bacterium]|nr:zinc ribbon domain-containing protein [Lachnospiraceae bacterium]
MAVCNVCGTYVEDGVKSCPNCGSPIAAAVAAQATQVVDQAAAQAAQTVDQVAEQVAQTADQAAPAAQAAPVAQAAPAFIGSVNSINGDLDAKHGKKLDALAAKLDGKDFTAQFSAAEKEDNKLWAVLAYFGLLCLIPLFVAKDSKYAKFHTNQGLLLLIIEASLGVASIIFSLIPFVKAVIAPIFLSVTILFGATMFVYGIMNAVQDRAKELPGIGGIRILK